MPEPYRFAYFPRTPPFSVPRSYSGLSSFPGFLRLFFFFMAFPLSTRGLARADDPNPLTTVQVRNHQYSTSVRRANRDESLFIRGVIGIVESQ